MKCFAEYLLTTQTISKILFFLHFFREDLFENIKQAPLEFPPYVSATARDLIMKLLNRNPKKRLGCTIGADEIKRHPFFKVIDWTKLFNRCYKPPEPYLKKRFDNFLQLSPSMQTNSEVYEKMKKENNLLTSPPEQHIQGWSFVQPSKTNE
jgi:serum/glucocorticoid-regulated kinase 2